MHSEILVAIFGLVTMTMIVGFSLMIASMLGRTEDNRITMTTCMDEKPSKRLCVQAVEIVKE